MLYDPVARHEAVESLVVRDSPAGEERKYWRFRSGRWYSGVVTAESTQMISFLFMDISFPEICRLL